MSNFFFVRKSNQSRLISIWSSVAKTRVQPKSVQNPMKAKGTPRIRAKNTLSSPLVLLSLSWTNCGTKSTTVVKTNPATTKIFPSRSLHLYFIARLKLVFSNTTGEVLISSLPSTLNVTPQSRQIHRMHGLGIRRFQQNRSIYEPRIVYQAPKSSLSDEALSNRVVPINSGAEIFF